jgi:hypothetical protein
VPSQNASGGGASSITTALLSLAVLPLWAFAGSAVWLAVGGFLMQVMVQGAWGVIPAHLNELSPDDARGTFRDLSISSAISLPPLMHRCKPALR